ncbi:MAG: DMT family transporter [Micropruina sp.]
MLGPLLALGAAVSYGIADFGGGMLSRRRPAAAVVGVTQGSSLVVLLVGLIVVGFPDTTAWLPWSVVAGACGAIGLVAFYRALAFGTIGVVSPISALGFGIPVIIGLVTGDDPSSVQLLGIGIAALGAVAASGPELKGEEHVKAQAVWLAALSGVAFGVTIYSLTRGGESSTYLTLVGMRVTSVTGFVIAALVMRSLGGVTVKDLPAMTAVGMMDVLANGLLAWASTMDLLSITAILSALYPVVTVGLAAVILKERLKTIQKIGVALAFLGIGLIAAG